MSVLILSVANYLLCNSFLFKRQKRILVSIPAFAMLFAYLFSSLSTFVNILFSVNFPFCLVVRYRPVSYFVHNRDDHQGCFITWRALSKPLNKVLFYSTLILIYIKAVFIIFYCLDRRLSQKCRKILFYFQCPFFCCITECYIAYQPS